MSKHLERTRAEAAHPFAQWGKAYDESVRNYFAATRSLSEAALKGQCALLDAAGQMLVAGNKVVAHRIEQLTNGKSDEDVRRSS
jgi:hypothetical protein